MRTLITSSLASSASDQIGCVITFSPQPDSQPDTFLQCLCGLSCCLDHSTGIHSAQTALRLGTVVVSGFVLAFLCILTFLIWLQAPSQEWRPLAAHVPWSFLHSRVNHYCHSCCCWAGHGGGKSTRDTSSTAKCPSSSEPSNQLELLFLLTHEVGAVLPDTAEKWDPSEAAREESVRCSALPSVPSFQTCVVNRFFFAGEGKCREEIWVLTLQRCFVFEGSACPLRAAPALKPNEGALTTPQSDNCTVPTELSFHWSHRIELSRLHCFHICLVQLFAPPLRQAKQDFCLEAAASLSNTQDLNLTTFSPHPISSELALLWHWGEPVESQLLNSNVCNVFLAPLTFTSSLRVEWTRNWW